MNEDIQNKIKNIVSSNDVVVFMKGTKDEPVCGFSFTVVKILNYLNVQFHDINVLADEEIRDGIKLYSEWPTIPQVYIKGEFIGGCDIIKEMFENKELHKTLQDKGVLFNPVCAE